MQSATRHRWGDRLTIALAAGYGLDRLFKLAAVVHFFGKAEPPEPPMPWPSVTLLQPITHGVSDLIGALACRSRLDYAGPIEHLLICDQADAPIQAICLAWIAQHPGMNARIVPVTVPDAPIASKVEKLQAALFEAHGDILCFVDDDVLLRTDAVRQLVCYLMPSQTGAVFGLACYVNWHNTASSLLSAFVNANALLNYIPLTYLTQPYTITGHLFALRREVFTTIGGLYGMEDGRIDDDHELARRVRQQGLRRVQTPVIYDVDNRLSSVKGYINQMQRWFIIPRQAMLPFLTWREQAVTVAGSAGNLLPPLLAAIALLTRRRTPVGALLCALAAYAAGYLFGEHGYLRRSTPLVRWPFVITAALVAPLQALAALLGGNEFDWRGQRLHLHRGGRSDRVVAKNAARKDDRP